jgi:PAS domain S-box-containing protein
VQLKLLIQRGERKGETIAVAAYPAVFGKGEECHFRFDELGVSRRHFILHCQNNTCWLEDLQSTNGTYVNKSKVSGWMALKEQDFIIAGKLALQVTELTLDVAAVNGQPSANESSVGAQPVAQKLQHFPPVVPKYETKGQTTGFANDLLEAASADPSITVRRHIEDIQNTSILGPSKEKLVHGYRALKTIYEVLQTCNSEPDHNRLFECLLLSLFKAIEANRGAIVLKTSDRTYEGKIFLIETKERQQFPISNTILTDVIRNGVSVISSDPTEDPRYRFSESLRLQKVRSLVCAPLISYQKVLGAVYLDRTRLSSHAFTEEDLELLAAIGIQIGSTLEKSLLLAEITKFNSYLKAVMESVPMGIHTLDLNGIFTDWSSYSEKIFGYSAGDIVNIAHVSLLFDSLAACEQIFSSLKEKGVSCEEVLLCTKDGTNFPCRFALSPIIDSFGNLLGYTGYHQNISEEKRIQEQIFTQEKMAAMGVLAAGVAHDFNHILSLIRGYASMSIEDAGEAPKHMAKVVAQVDRAADITAHLLQYSRQESKQFITTNPLTLLEDVLELVHKELHASNIQVVKNLAPLMPLAIIPGQIQEVFLNIILNARDAMDGGGTLNVTTWQAQGYDQISFEDTGKGIEPSHLVRLFEPFFTTKQKSEKSGSGLGLAISYQIMQKHKGKITVQSTPGKGSKFTMWLPIPPLSTQRLAMDQLTPSIS